MWRFGLNDIANSEFLKEGLISPVEGYSIPLLNDWE